MTKKQQESPATLLFPVLEKVYEFVRNLTWTHTQRHDGWVDFDYHENTGELSDLYDESDLDQYIDNLNDRN